MACAGPGVSSSLCSSWPLHPSNPTEYQGSAAKEERDACGRRFYTFAGLRAAQHANACWPPRWPYPLPRIPATERCDFPPPRQAPSSGNRRGTDEALSRAMPGQGATPARVPASTDAGTEEWPFAPFTPQPGQDGTPAPSEGEATTTDRKRAMVAVNGYLPCPLSNAIQGETVHWVLGREGGTAGNRHGQTDHTSLVMPRILGKLMEQLEPWRERCLSCFLLGRDGPCGHRRLGCSPLNTVRFLRWRNDATFPSGICRACTLPRRLHAGHRCVYSGIVMGILYVVSRNDGWRTAWPSHLPVSAEAAFESGMWCGERGSPAGPLNAHIALRWVLARCHRLSAERPLHALSRDLSGGGVGRGWAAVARKKAQGVPA
ncbi:hypothetical protein CALCODRAFT_201170 [Calocera cornea HHB12733]|uniref:Uncharacterized protein n=1 Tax=Calocera cornea HHB12733 TaxID=1353952 RepID=A0A165C517_9BASI|nr:hypothetical protein CALCODRAFT_201170 [Calocera cornea HHB12733]